MLKLEFMVPIKLGEVELPREDNLASMELHTHISALIDLLLWFYVCLSPAIFFVINHPTAMAFDSRLKK